jgi:hypothetical protein
MTAAQERNDRISLSTSGWNYFRPVYPAKHVRVGCLLVPFLVLLAFVGSSDLWLAGIIVFGLVQLLTIRSQRGAYATTSVIHYRYGLLGLRSVEIALTQVDDVVAETLPFAGRELGDLGDITVRCGSRLVSFECVRHATAIAQELLARRDRARGQGRAA